ncbi:MAG: serine peptidase, partial [Proteobacteria bacterium]|nr:serine peptidase [Pseudomonadota bacterium]
MTQTIEHHNKTTRRNPGAARRTLLLGTVAALALTGAVAQDVFFNGHGANAATASAATALPAAGPQSFADVVERVKGSVVSIKVKSLRSNVSDD